MKNGNKLRLLQKAKNSLNPKIKTRFYKKKISIQFQFSNTFGNRPPGSGYIQALSLKPTISPFLTLLFLASIKTFKKLTFFYSSKVGTWKIRLPIGLRKFSFIKCSSSSWFLHSWFLHHGGGVRRYMILKLAALLKEGGGGKIMNLLF